MNRNRFSKDKLLQSKWTALQVVNKERHFLVVEVIRDPQTNQVQQCVLQAVMTKNEYSLNPNDLRDSNVWQMGWK